MKDKISVLISSLLGIDKSKVLPLIEVPKNECLGDYALPCFSFAKELKKNPLEISKELAQKLSASKEFEKVESKGPYLNFYLNRVNISKDIIKNIIKSKDKYGYSKEGKDKIMMEFPSPNTNKPLHLGHLRNIALGMSVSNILESQGNKLIISNLNNDRGVHICKSMLAYQKWGNNKTPESEKIKSDHLIGDFYVMFSKAAKDNPKLEEEAQEMLRKWESKDKGTLAIWKKMNKWALDGFKETYKSIGLKIDKEYFESEIYMEGKELILDGLAKGIFKKKDDGAIIADLSSEGLGEKVVLRADGTSIYITQDLYLAVLKNKDFKIDGSIYVVANEQDYHFKVLFSILKKFGFNFTNKLKHLSYGMVELPEGRMKSREGTVVDADDLIKETQNLAKEEIKKRGDKLNERELDDRSLKIALCAIKYMLLKVDPSKNIVFNPNEAISFEGNTGPYLLYTYARSKSILTKAKKSKKSEDKITDIEKSLIIKLGEFPSIVEKASEILSPNLIANYAFDISQKFNEFYHSEQVIGSENEQFKLSLVLAFSIVLKNALNLLGIKTLEKM